MYYSIKSSGHKAFISILPWKRGQGRREQRDNNILSTKHAARETFHHRCLSDKQFKNARHAGCLWLLSLNVAPLKSTFCSINLPENLWTLGYKVNWKEVVRLSSSIKWNNNYYENAWPKGKQVPESQMKPSPATAPEEAEQVQVYCISLYLWSFTQNSIYSFWTQGKKAQSKGLRLSWGLTYYKSNKVWKDSEIESSQ